MPVPNNVPAYRILSGFYGPDDHLYKEGDEIFFHGEPNEDMEPLNELGRTAQREYFEKLDALGKAAAEKAGRAWVGRAKELSDVVHLATQDARRVSLVSGDGGVPLMGAKHNGPAQVGKLDAEPVPQTGGGKGNGTLSINRRG